jgi:hypothetical protein
LLVSRTFKIPLPSTEFGDKSSSQSHADETIAESTTENSNVDAEIHDIVGVDEEKDTKEQDVLKKAADLYDQLLKGEISVSSLCVKIKF